MTSISLVKDLKQKLFSKRIDPTPGHIIALENMAKPFYDVKKIPEKELIFWLERIIGLEIYIDKATK